MPNHLRGELRKITRFLFLPRDGSTYFSEKLVALSTL
jgi:hypothetical protein